jgi:hypothetical protein
VRRKGTGTGRKERQCGGSEMVLTVRNGSAAGETCYSAILCTWSDLVSNWYVGDERAVIVRREVRQKEMCVKGKERIK